MTVSRAISSLNTFISKIEEAVSLVPGMCAEDKLKAVQFWNIVSEKLQDIVNNSAADINAIALKLDEEENAEIHLDVNSHASIIGHTSEISAEFENIPSNYTICNETEVQFHTNIINNDLKSFIPNNFLLNNSKHSSLTELSHANQLQLHTSEISSSSLQSGQFVYIENIPSNSCDTLSKPTHSSSPVSILEIKNDNHKINLPHSPKKSVIQSQEQCKVKKRRYENEQHLDSDSLSVIINSKSPKNDDLAPPLHQGSSAQNNTINLKQNIESSGDSYSENKASLQDLETSNDSTFEPIDCFETSNSEEILDSNEADQSSKTNFEDFDNSIFNVICKICSKSFTDEDSLERHHLQIHERNYSCLECEAKFSTRGNLIVHMRRHTGEKPFGCNKCNASFTTKGNLQRHIKTHSGEKPWECDECGTCFTEKKSLTVHMRRHTGEKPFKCQVCGKCFSQTSILQTHMAMHSDVKTHLCEICGKSFRQKSQLRVHRLRHDNVRPFNCTTCTASFLTKGDLLRHERTHTREKPFTCEICSKCFTRQQSLNEHKNRHNGVKPYKCKHCGKAFPEMSGCYKHMKCHTKTKEMEPNITSPKEPTEQVTNAPSHTKVTEKKLHNPADAHSYIAVVLNAKDSGDIGNEINHAVSIINSGVEENNIGSNGIGVLTAINILTNSSPYPQNFLNTS